MQSQPSSASQPTEKKKIEVYIYIALSLVNMQIVRVLRKMEGKNK